MKVVYTYLFVVCGGRGSGSASCVAIVSGCLRIAQSGVLLLPRPAYRARCVGYSRPSSRLSGVQYPSARDVWSMFARHRCHHLLSSGVETYRGRCVVNVRASSLSPLVVLGVGPYRVRCVANVRTSSLSSLVTVGDPTLLLLPLPPCVANGLTSSLSSLAIVGDRTLLLYYHRMCGQCSHGITDGHRLGLLGIGHFCHYYRSDVWPIRMSSLTPIACDCRGSDPFATTIAKEHVRIEGIFANERFLSLARRRCHRMLLSRIEPCCYYYRRTGK